MSDQNHHHIAEAAIAALNARDLDAYCNLLDDSYIWDHDAFPSPVHGKEGVRQAMNLYFTAFPDIRLELGHVVSNDDLLVNCWHATGTHQGEFLGLAATGLPIRTRGCTVSQLRNGLIVHSTTYSDQLALLQQLTPKAAAAT